MNKQSVLIGEIVIDNGPAITLHAQLPEDGKRETVAVLKDKLAYLLDSRFRPAEPEVQEYVTLDDVTERWRCHRATVLRMIRDGQLHPIEVDGDLRFDRVEVLSLANTVPSRTN